MRAICTETVVNAHGVAVASPFVQEVSEELLASRPDAFTIANLADGAPVKATAARAERTAAKPAARRRTSSVKKKA